MKKGFFFFCLGILLALPSTVDAARLYFLPLSVHVQKDTEFTVELRLDTQGENINALDIGVIFSKDTLVFDSFSDASSLVNIWIEYPSISPEKPGRVSMSGVAPGGFMGDAPITHLTFHGTRAGDTLLTVARDSRVVLDGSVGQLVFTVSNNSLVKIGEKSLDQASRTTEPAGIAHAPTVTAQLSKTPIAYNDKWFVSFIAQDKDFGIKGYQIREKFLGVFGGKWKKVESPYVIEHQHLLSTIEIQALANSDISGEIIVIPGRLKVIYGLLIASLISLLFGSVIKRTMWGLPKVG